MFSHCDLSCVLQSSVVGGVKNCFMSLSDTRILKLSIMACRAPQCFFLVVLSKAVHAAQCRTETLGCKCTDEQLNPE